MNHDLKPRLTPASESQFAAKSGSIPRPREPGAKPVCIRLELRTRVTNSEARIALRAELLKRTKQLPEGTLLKDGSVSFGWFVRERNVPLREGDRVLMPLAKKLGAPKVNCQILRRTTPTQAQCMGSVRDIQAHLRHAKADTTANEYMQEAAQERETMVGSVYTVIKKEENTKQRREYKTAFGRFATKCRQIA